jgi:hypothetical protein
MARVANFAALWRLARQDRTAALKFQNNQYRGSDTEAITDRRGSFKLSRHRAWRGRVYMVTSPEPTSVAASATPHHMARVASFAAPWRLVRQFEAIAPLVYDLGVRAMVLVVLKLKRGSAVLQRHRAWRVKVTLPRHRGWRGKPGDGSHPCYRCCPGLPRQGMWRGRHTLSRHARRRGKPDASQQPNFLQVSVALTDSTHLHKNSSIHIHKPIWGHFPCTKHSSI